MFNLFNFARTTFIAIRGLIIKSLYLKGYIVHHALTPFMLLGWSVALCVAVAITYSNEMITQPLKVSYLNIGQGDSVLIQTPDNHSLMIDGGPPTANILSEVGAVMPFYRNHIDAILATHPDQDHIGGLPAVIGRYSPNLFLWSGVHSGTWSDVKLSDKVNESPGKNKMISLLVRRGMKIVLDRKNNITLDIKFPDRDTSTWIKKTNDASIVARLAYGSTSFLYTGDSPSNVEHYLISKNWIEPTDVLKVGHHGSKNSTSDEFVKALSPAYGVISVGAQNRYGHPTKEVLDILQNNHVKIFRTDQDGRVTIESDGKSLTADK